MSNTSKHIINLHLANVVVLSYSSNKNGKMLPKNDGFRQKWHYILTTF